MVKFDHDATISTPWAASYGKVPFHLDYPEGMLVDELQKSADQYPDYIAYEFMGKKTTYQQMMAEIHRVARALAALGIKEDQRVLICMPNCPQAVLTFYALNLVGAVAAMVHPLSAEGELIYFLQESESAAVLTLDQFYPKFMEIKKQYPLPTLLIARVKDALPPIKKLGFSLTMGRKLPKVSSGDGVLLWDDFLAGGDAWQGEYVVRRQMNDPAVILFSGGTSGKSKGVLLSNLALNAQAEQTVAMDTNYIPGDKMLAVMPIFHGFGLGVGIHTFLGHGGCCLLIPRFTPQTYAELLYKQRPNYIAGVPTLYEALLTNPELDNVDLSSLKGVFSGGDSLSIELKKKFDRFLAEHNAPVAVREGYGATECVTASCLTPYRETREGSIGLPFPDTYYKICDPQTNEELPYGEEGEICLTGPSLMLGYLNHPDETADALRRHSDGHVWLHTGDLGLMDADGFIYYRQRIKRMIITSGYNVYPSQLENIIDAHEKVLMSCVIGVPDQYKKQRVKAFVMLPRGIEPSDELREELLEYCRKHIAKYAMPKEIEFRSELPRTLVGKVAYRQLEEEELAKLAAAAQADLDEAVEQAAAIVGDMAEQPLPN